MRKYLYMSNIYFELPENFEGNLTDALEEIIKYRRSDEAKKKRKLGEPGEYVNSAGEANDILDSNDTRLVFNFAFLERTEDDEFAIVDSTGLEG